MEDFRTHYLLRHMSLMLKHSPAHTHAPTIPHIPPPCDVVLCEVHHLVDGREVEGRVGDHTVVS